MNKFISLIIFNFLLLYSFGYNIAIVGLCSSHLYNTIPFAKLLRENGHDVTYVTTVECKSRVLGAGAVLYKEKKWDAFVSSLGDSYLPGPLKALSFGREYLWYYSSTSSDELDAWLQEGNRPDIIVSHALHPLVPTYADKYDIPYLLFYANGFHLVTEETIHKTQFKIDGRATEGSFVYNQISEVQKVGFYIFYSMLQCIDKINHIREEHGLPKFTTSSHLWQSYPLVTPLAQPFVYHGEIDNLYKISPLPHITSKETIPEDILTWLQSSKQPVIYMALGTSTNLTEENIETILGQFQLQRNYRILWSLKQVEAYEKKIVDPNHLMIKKFLPQIALLERPEIAGFLTHCGAASIMEAVKFEVPLILYPQGRDQMFTAMNAFDAGVGIYLNSPETLSKVLAEFMDKHDVLKKNVVEARKQVASIKGWDRLSKLITDLARSKKSSFIQRDDVLLFYIYKWLTILAMLVLGILSLFGYIFYRCCCKSKPKKLKQQ